MIMVTAGLEEAVDAGAGGENCITLYFINILYFIIILCGLEEAVDAGAAGEEQLEGGRPVVGEGVPRAVAVEGVQLVPGVGVVGVVLVLVIIIIVIVIVVVFVFVVVVIPGQWLTPARSRDCR